MSAPSPTQLPDNLEPAWDVARLFPPQGSWSEDEYLRLPGNHLPEYWLVDPEAQSITVLVLDAGNRTYAEHGGYQHGDTATSPTLPGFALPVASLFVPAA